MTQLCYTRGPTCRPCDDPPVLNLTAEGPDDDVFVGVYDFNNNTNIGDLFNSNGCKSWCFSTISQADADACAQAQAADCGNNNNGGGGGNPDCPTGNCNDPDKPPTPHGDTFYSAEYRLDCPNGGDFVVSGSLPSNLSIDNNQLTCTAGSFTSSISQSDADSKAAVYTNNEYGILTADDTLSCEAAWGYIYKICGPDTNINTSIEGVVGTGNHLEVIPTDTCIGGTEVICKQNAHYDFQYNKRFGPFDEDKNVTISGTYDISRLSTAPPSPCFNTAEVSFQAYANGLTSYSGTITKSLFGPPGNPNADSGFIVITGVLASGATVDIGVICEQASTGILFPFNITFDVTLT